MPISAPRGVTANATGADRLRRLLVSRRSGIVRNVRILRPRMGGDAVRVCHADLSDIRRTTSARAEDTWFDAFGAGWTVEGALGSALGEALERYGSLIAGAGRHITWASQDELAPLAIPLDSFVRPTRQEREAEVAGMPGPHPGQRLGWVEGLDLRTGAAVMGPASTILGGYPGRHFEAPQRPLTNKGLAAGYDVASCLRHGLCEIIEADAFMICFLNSMPVPEVDLGAVTAEPLGRLAAFFDPTARRSVRAWNITTDIGVPAVLAAATDQVHGGPVITFGAAASPDPWTALEKGVLEALQSTAWMNGDAVLRARRPPTFPDLTRVRDRATHKLLAARPDYIATLDWLFRPRTRVAVDDLPDLSASGDTEAELRRIVDRLTAVGLASYAFDLTPPDIAAIGMQVWHMLVPQAQPFSLGPVRCLEGERLYDVPRRLGYRGTRSTERDLTVHPHPCP